MKTTRTTTTALAVGFLLTLAVGTARAGPIYTISIGSFSGGTGVIHAPGTLAGGANGINVELGSVKITGDLGTFEGYCVDLDHYVNPNTTVNTAVSTMDQWNWRSSTSPSKDLAGGRASWLYLTFAPKAIADKSVAERAGLSLAIWNALYDTDFDVSSGTGFWATNTNSAYVTAANSMLSELAKAQTTSTLPQAAWLQTADGPGNYTQDFIAPIPEPGTMALVAVGLASAVVSRRRKKDK